MSSFDESQVRRGQPDNPGQFTSKDVPEADGGIDALVGTARQPRHSLQNTKSAGAYGPHASVPRNAPGGADGYPPSDGTAGTSYQTGAQA